MSKLLPLSKGYHAIVDEDDFDRCNAIKWFADVRQKTKYIRAICNKTNGNMHRKLSRFILNAPPEMLIDHINRNPLDNRKQNLRLVDKQQNSQNRTKNQKGSSRYKGVPWNTGVKAWTAQIHIKRKKNHLGCFELETDAAIAYNKAAIEHFGEFAALNEIGLATLGRLGR